MMSLSRKRGLPADAPSGPSLRYGNVGKRCRVVSSEHSWERPLDKWAMLPELVRRQILALLRDEKDNDIYDPFESFRKGHLANYACVSLEWQEFFEAANFRRLVLHQGQDLLALNAFIERRCGRARVLNTPKMGLAGSRSFRRHMPVIQHIWLQVELPRYNCNRCMTNDWIDQVFDDQVFSDAVWDLLDVLRRWEQRGLRAEGQKNGLTLQLSAHSPSDELHLFRFDPGMQLGYPNRGNDSKQERYIRLRHLVCRQHSIFKDSDENHFFHEGRLRLPVAGEPGEEMVPEIRHKLVSNLRLLNPGRERGYRYPEAKMVTGLLFRRQHYRNIMPVSLSLLLRQSLTGLREFRQEGWRRACTSDREEYDRSLGPVRTLSTDFDVTNTDSGTTLGEWLPSSLESLHLFEDFNENIFGSLGVAEPRPSQLRVLAGVAGVEGRTRLAKWMGLAGLEGLPAPKTIPRIKHLSVSFLSDAMECLDLDGHDEAMFPDLESIALTSQHHLRPDHPGLNDLLLTAALAAKRMPKLQIMEIWNCGDGAAAFFRYEANADEGPHAAKITWRCSWEAPSPFRGRVLKAWGEVASDMAQNPLVAVEEPLPKGRYHEYANILRHLKLRRSILHATSEMQVRVEAEIKDKEEEEKMASTESEDEDEDGVDVAS